MADPLGPDFAAAAEKRRLHARAGGGFRYGPVPQRADRRGGDARLRETSRHRNGQPEGCRVQTRRGDDVLLPDPQRRQAGIGETPDHPRERRRPEGDLRTRSEGGGAMCGARFAESARFRDGQGDTARSLRHSGETAQRSQRAVRTRRRRRGGYSEAGSAGTGRFRRVLEKGEGAARRGAAPGTGTQSVEGDRDLHRL